MLRFACLCMCLFVVVVITAGVDEADFTMLDAGSAMFNGMVRATAFSFVRANKNTVTITAKIMVAEAMNFGNRVSVR